jgi:hypothetical protein
MELVTVTELLAVLVGIMVARLHELLPMLSTVLNAINGPAWFGIISKT